MLGIPVRSISETDTYTLSMSNIMCLCDTGNLLSKLKICIGARLLAGISEIDKWIHWYSKAH